MHSSNFTIQTFPTINHQHAWRFLAPNHQVVAIGGETYHNKADMLHAIDLIKKGAAIAPFGGLRFVMFPTSNLQWSWRLLAANGKSVAFAGEQYHHQSDAQHGIDLVKQYFANAIVGEPVR